MARLTTRSRSVAGKVALVTGAASGMGRATAHLFADEGARVVATDQHLEGVEKTVGEIVEAGGEAIGLQLDVRQPDRITEVVDVVTATYGVLRLLRNHTWDNGPEPLAPAHFQDAP